MIIKVSDYLIQNRKERIPSKRSSQIVRNLFQEKDSDKHGYYKWWAGKESFNCLKKAFCITSFSDTCIETKDIDGEKWYCIYIGIAVKEPLAARINWHINDVHTESKIRNRTLSTLRQSISSLLFSDMSKQKDTDLFMKELKVEYYVVNDEKSNLLDIERRYMEERFSPLNISDNGHEDAIDCKRVLLCRRCEARDRVLNK